MKRVSFFLLALLAMSAVTASASPQNDPPATMGWMDDAEPVHKMAVQGCDDLVDFWVTNITRTLNMTVHLLGKTYNVRWFPVNTSVCYANFRDQVLELTNRLCSAPWSLYVTCDPTYLRPIGEDLYRQAFPVRIAVRGHYDYSLCECRAPPHESDEFLGLPPAHRQNKASPPAPAPAPVPAPPPQVRPREATPNVGKKRKHVAGPPGPPGPRPPPPPPEPITRDPEDIEVEDADEV